MPNFDIYQYCETAKDEFKLHAFSSEFQKMRRFILNSNNAEYCFEFAKLCNSLGLGVQCFQDVIVKINDPKWIYKFARAISKCDRVALRNVLIKINNEKWINAFDANVKIQKKRNNIQV